VTGRTGSASPTGVTVRLALRAVRSGPGRRLTRIRPVRAVVTLPSVSRRYLDWRGRHDPLPLPRFPRLEAEYARSGEVRVRSAPIDDGPSTITTRFVVLATPRSGSTLLISELDRRWATMRCLGEAFGPDKRGEASIEACIGSVFFHETGEPIVGCKIFLAHVEPEGLAQILALPHMRVVILRRGNILRQHVSSRIAEADGRWVQPRHDRRRTAEERCVPVDPLGFLHASRRIELIYRWYDTLTAGLPVLQITYEELSADLDATVRRVAAFLDAGEPDRGGPPDLVRQNPEPLSMLVRNHDELCRVVRRHGLGHLLDPDDAPAGRRRGRRRAVFEPDEAQELLLHLAFDPPGRELELVGLWFDAVDRRQLDAGSRRLLPLVHRRLRAAGCDDRRLADLWGLQLDARRTHLQMLAALAPVVATLDAAGIATLVLDGAALSLAGICRVGDRPVDRLDVAVPFGLVADAAAALAVEGWASSDPPPGPDESVRADTHAAVLIRNGVRLRLSDAGLAGMPGPAELAEPAGMAAGALDAVLWAGAVAVEVGGRPARVLAPGDQLLRTLVTALRWDGEDDIAWVADANLLITSAGAQLDWQRLADLAGRHGLGPPLVTGIDHLARTFPGLIPADAMAAVRAVPVSRAQRRAFERRARRQPGSAAR